MSVSADGLVKTVDAVDRLFVNEPLANLSPTLLRAVA